MVRVFAKIEEAPEVARHGQVFTKPHIVGLILDLCGYTCDRPLSSLRLLDPGCGDGAFLVDAARRLLGSREPRTDPKVLANCLMGVENDEELAEKAMVRLRDLLLAHAASPLVAATLARGWIRKADFVVDEIPGPFDVIVGNPPYVRQEAIDKEALALYRSRFPCFYDRADLYMAFIEKGLSLLSGRGVLGFICPNRFTRNRYGKKLRSLIVNDYQLIDYIDLAETCPFEPEVLAYPGIFVIGRGKTRRVRFVRMTSASPEEAARVCRVLRCADHEADGSVALHDYDEWFTGEDPWITESPEHLKLIRRLEARFPCLGSDASGTRVGIGVATGADSLFIVDKDFPHVEPELLLPLVMTGDCVTGEVQWRGRCVINPFKSESTAALIDLDQYPRARAYFDTHRHRIQRRNVAKRNVRNWYRTIDRIYPSLARKPKLLIPDIKVTNHIVYESGQLYPHHNLYYIVSDHWDLLALRTILRSSLAKFFVWVYGVKMRSSYLRFQAQYLRRIRVPAPVAVSKPDIRQLRDLNGGATLEQVDAAMARLYGLEDRDTELILETLQGAASPQPA